MEEKSKKSRQKWQEHKNEDADENTVRDTQDGNERRRRRRRRKRRRRGRGRRKREKEGRKEGRIF